MVDKQEIQKKLDEQYLLDIKDVMSIPQGRRVFSYLLQRCGFKDADMKGNSRDFHAAGRRSVAIDLIFSCDALGIEGVDLRQKAEREYILFQMRIAEEIRLNKEKELNETNGKMQAKTR